MIANDTELQVTLARFADFQAQVVFLRETMSDAESYRLSAGGFLAEIEQMETEVREYLRRHPTELAASAWPKPFLSTESMAAADPEEQVRRCQGRKRVCVFYLGDFYAAARWGWAQKPSQSLPPLT